MFGAQISVGGEHLLLLHFLVIGPSIISCLGSHLEDLKLKIEDQHKALSRRHTAAR